MYWITFETDKEITYKWDSFGAMNLAKMLAEQIVIFF